VYHSDGLGRVVTEDQTPFAADLYRFRDFVYHGALFVMDGHRFLLSKSKPWHWLSEWYVIAVRD
jgi:hypothetical protein